MKIAETIIFLLSLNFIASLPVYSQNETSNNVSIFNKTENYEFVKGNIENPVQVKENCSTVFICNGFRTSIPFAEFYNGKTSIDEVKIYVSGDKAKNIIPKYNYYSVDDIFYSDAHLCYFQLPLEKKNSQSEVDIAKTITDPRYFSSIYFDELFNLENKQVILKVPSWVQLEIKEYNFPRTGITKTIAHQGDNTIYTYSINRLPARITNKNAPGPSFLYPHILLLIQSAQPEGIPAVTYFKNLQQLYNWYHSLANQIGNDESSFRDQVHEIVKDKKTDADKIQAVYNWVQSNIRYIAFEDGIAGFKPEKAQEVFRKKYGDCKGMANLTKEMLKVLGYDARLCWLGTDHIAYDYSTPCLAADNHMICALKQDGKFRFLDATEKYIGPGEYAQRIQGRQVLIENGSDYILDRVPVEENIQNTESETQTLQIENADITGKVSLNYKGESKEYMLFALNSVSGQNRENALQSFLSNNKSNYKIQNLNSSALDNWNGDMSIKYDFRFTNAVTDFGNEKYIDLDFNKEFSDLLIDSSRKQDFILPYKFNISTETELLIPPGFTLEQPPAPLIIKNATYSFNLQYLLSGNKLIYKKHLEVYNPSIKVAEFRDWNLNIAKLNEFYNEQITLKKE